MTRKETIDALLEGRQNGRPLLFPFLLGFCARNVGFPISEIYSDAEKSFDAQMKTIEQYGFDWGPIYGYASYGTWEFGGAVKMPSGTYEQAPLHTMFPVQDESDLLEIALPDVKTAGCLPIAMAFSRLQAEHAIPITFVSGGSFTVAGNICPVEKLCRWMLKKPELAHRVLRLATDHIVDITHYWADTFGAAQVIPLLWEPLASNQIISPKLFEKMVLPYLVESSEKILAMGIKHIFYHICGDQNANLARWREVPMGDPGICSFGAEIDIAKAIEVMGDDAIIVGNIDTNIILNGPAHEIYGLCKDAIEKGKNAPRGFMLSSACEVSPNTPGYNVYLMKKAAGE